MAAALEDTTVSYEDLEAIENDFEEAEVTIIRQQIALTTPIYLQRQKVISQIPNFWPLVLEQAPPDIDQYIQPSDSALLLSSLTSISVSHFEISDPAADPRSVAIRFDFSDNEYFEDKWLEKKLWYRRAKDGWSGLVSEPVDIKWKSREKDLTGGLLGLVVEAWEEGKISFSNGQGNGDKKKKKPALTDKQKILKKKIESTGMGGTSFFAWFGFIGRRITAEESAEAAKLEQEKRERRKKGEKVESKPEEPTEEEEDEDEDEFDLESDLEIFPDGDDLAVSITEDLWPGAIKYFTQAQEQDALSDMDFESDDDPNNNISDLEDSSLPQHSDLEEDTSDVPPNKRQKAS